MKGNVPMSDIINIDKIYDRTYNAIYGIILNSFEKQRYIKKKDLYYLSSSKAFLNEFCTVKICGPRASCHTTVISEISKEYDSWVIFPNNEQIKIFRKLFSYKTKLFSINHEFKGYKLPTIVFLDQASFISKNKLMELVNYFSSHIDYKKDFCFVQIQ